MSTPVISGYRGLRLISHARAIADRLWQAYVEERRTNGSTVTAMRYSNLWIRANDVYVRYNLAYRNNTTASVLRKQKRR
jgi:hypothetical protein